ncbi:MAG: hypothetical protein M0Z34_11335, partial [Nitrospiraceae bacterium]|nr:hypothetical protein [Nitrospiraceae bacterium]
GSDETGILPLASVLPSQASYAALRAPIAEGGGYAWFANHGIGRPRPESLRKTMDWFSAWLSGIAADRPVVLVGFSGGAAFAGGLILDDPSRYAGAAILYGTVPFDAGVPVTPGRLAGTKVMVAQGERDAVMPPQLMSRTWEYLVTASGAEVTAVRDPGGHAISQAAAIRLGAWITEVTGIGATTS